MGSRAYGVERHTLTAKYGFFSATNARNSGVCEYTTPDGRKVSVTEVYAGHPKQMQKDSVFVGEVVDCVRVKPMERPFCGITITDPFLDRHFGNNPMLRTDGYKMISPILCDLTGSMIGALRDSGIVDIGFRKPEVPLSFKNEDVFDAPAFMDRYRDIATNTPKATPSERNYSGIIRLLAEETLSG